ncbi:hypothetical protein C0Q70_18705 [Pomacea canaliculata]|uniref:Uncharacterized protein n=1 Tax=Pomacea canaliculata TaxID=400727 RepID=A0A2T7NH93_POMCA|nr:hypothetical protein C0Q70_18705 [Pomacea canaliculata]
MLRNSLATARLVGPVAACWQWSANVNRPEGSRACAGTVTAAAAASHVEGCVSQGVTQINQQPLVTFHDLAASQVHLHGTSCCPSLADKMPVIALGLKH